MAKKPAEPDFTEIILDDFDKFENFVLDNWRIIVAVSVVIVIAVTVVATVMNFRESAENEAVAALLKAKTIDEMKGAIEKYPECGAVPSVRMQLAKLYYDKKNYDQAIAEYQKIATSQTVPDEMCWEARMCIAYTSEIAGKPAMAAGEFASIGSDALVIQPLRAEANYNAGRLYVELGKPKEARAVLRRVISLPKPSAPTSFWGDQARGLMDRLGPEKEDTQS